MGTELQHADKTIEKTPFNNCPSLCRFLTSKWCRKVILICFLGCMLAFVASNFSNSITQSLWRWHWFSWLGNSPSFTEPGSSLPWQQSQVQSLSLVPKMCRCCVNCRVHLHDKQFVRSNVTCEDWAAVTGHCVMTHHDHFLRLLRSQLAALLLNN
jgi:hypothetical protein